MSNTNQSKPINLKAKINKYGISVYVDKIKYSGTLKSRPITSSKLDV